MKHIRILSLALLAIAALASCKSTSTNTKKQASQGQPYEIIIVAGNDEWGSALSDTLQSVLKETIPVLNSPEPLYTTSRIHPNSYDGMLRLHRNILLVEANEKYEAPAIHAQYDVTAAPQIIVSLTGPDVKSMTQYVSDYRKELQTIFEAAERNRSLALNRSTENKALGAKIFDKFGFNIVIPNTYLEAEANAQEDFMWLRKHYNEAEQGIIIYKYPYTGNDDFTRDSLLNRRNEFVARIEGSNAGSHMTTAPVFKPLLAYKRIHGRNWAEMRGFWDMEGDYYGGPFVSYSTLDRATQQVITIDMYILSPNHGKMKRNYYRQLEHLMFSVSFPEDKAVKVEAKADTTAVAAEQ